jgi:hypothetical protein
MGGLWIGLGQFRGENRSNLRRPLGAGLSCFEGLHPEAPTLDSYNPQIWGGLWEWVSPILRTYTLRLPPLRLQPSNLGKPLGVGLLNLLRSLFDENI